MCRNIKPLFNFEPPATVDEVRASALQFVRKVSGYTKPSKANEEAFNDAVEEVTAAARRLVESLVTTAPPRDRAQVAAEAKARSAQRFAPAQSPDAPRARSRSSCAVPYSRPAPRRLRLRLCRLLLSVAALFRQRFLAGQADLP